MIGKTKPSGRRKEVFGLNDHPDQQKERSTKGEFSDKIGRLSRSEAYRNFCEEVYGYRMALFNMMDREQLDFLYQSIAPAPADTILDLGCGNGSILNWLNRQSGCKGIGIDQLDCELFDSSNPSISYRKGDMEEIQTYEVHSDITISIDSLYFCKQPGAMLRYRYRNSRKGMYLFYSQYLFENEAEQRELLQSDGTRLAQTLKRNGIPYATIDYSKNERMLYTRALDTLRAYRHAFELEGNLDLVEQKFKEDLLGKQLYEEGRASRYLYRIPSPSEEREN